MAKGIHHIALKAQGLEEFRATLEFYQTVLDCPVIRSWEDGGKHGAMLDLGNTILEVTSDGTGAGTGVFPHIAFVEEDVDGMLERVRQAGREVMVPPTDVNIGGSYPVRIAFCRGPAGEEIEFFQEKK